METYRKVASNTVLTLSYFEVLIAIFFGFKTNWSVGRTIAPFYHSNLFTFTTFKGVVVLSIMIAISHMWLLYT